MSLTQQMQWQWKKQQIANCAAGDGDIIESDSPYFWYLELRIGACVCVAHGIPGMQQHMQDGTALPAAEWDERPPRTDCLAAPPAAQSD